MNRGKGDFFFAQHINHLRTRRVFTQCLFILG
ncbi:Uncharacterised protein [Vibrio cholerae]|nr:Uncharacterised protein [Vibrio cholerae]